MPYTTKFRWFLSVGMLCGAIATTVAAQDPWPFWQRTANRLGNTDTIGPRTATLEWSVLFSTHPSDEIHEASPIMDRAGRIFVGTTAGVTGIDSARREMIWEAMDGDVARGAAVWGRRVVWGDVPPFSNLYCYDAETGENVWTIQIGLAMYSAPVVDPNGVIYISDQGRLVHARRIEDGSEVWTKGLGNASFSSPALDWPLLLTSSGTPNGSDLVGLLPSTGASQWSFGTSREIFGTNVLHGGRIYLASTDRYLYCVDALTGLEIWRFFTEQHNRGCVAIGHDGTIYTGTGGNFGILFAVSPEGKELWRFLPNGLIFNAPIVGGEGTIYFCAYSGDGYRGRVHAMRADGTVLWTYNMPNDVNASPMLAPDGTLYIVCRDKNLYAFRDPHTAATLTNLDVTTGDILEGDISTLDEVDDNVLRIRSGFGNRLSDLHNMELSLNATVDDPDFDILRIQIKTWIDQPTGVGTVQLKNWSTGEFETVRTYILEDKPFFEWIQIPKGGNNEPVDPHRYVRLSGAIELKMKNIVFVPFLAFTFETMIDQIKIEVN